MFFKVWKLLMINISKVVLFGFSNYNNFCRVRLFIIIIPAITINSISTMKGKTTLTSIFVNMHNYIIWLSNLSTLSVPDEGYSRNASCALNLIFTFLLWCILDVKQFIGNYINLLDLIIQSWQITKLLQFSWSYLKY